MNDQVTLSVIADGARDNAEPVAEKDEPAGPIRTTRLVHDDQLWLEVTWEPAA